MLPYNPNAFMFMGPQNTDQNAKILPPPRVLINGVGPSRGLQATIVTLVLDILVERLNSSGKIRPKVPIFLTSKFCLALWMAKPVLCRPHNTSLPHIFEPQHNATKED